MSEISGKPNFGPVDRAPYQLVHLLRCLPENFSSYAPLLEDCIPVAETVAHHASNANDLILRGIAAIGHVMMQAGLNEEGSVAGRHIASLGDLITHLAVEAEAMQELGWMIREATADGPDGDG